MILVKYFIFCLTLHFLKVDLSTYFMMKIQRYEISPQNETLKFIERSERSLYASTPMFYYYYYYYYYLDFKKN